jgi:hypothetical protein
VKTYRSAKPFVINFTDSVYSPIRTLWFCCESFGNDPLELSIYKYLIENAASEIGWDKQEQKW